MPLDSSKLERAVNTTEKLVRRIDALESRRKDDYGHPVKSNNRVQQTDYGQEADNKKSVDVRRGQEDRGDADETYTREQGEKHRGEGKKIAKEGGSRQKNPYTEGSRSAREWARGYDQGKGYE